jgi:hypothetical protein
MGMKIRRVSGKTQQLTGKKYRPPVSGLHARRPGLVDAASYSGFDS